MHANKILSSSNKLLPIVVKYVLENKKLIICFNEFKLTSIVDTLVLRIIIASLLKGSIVLVTISSRTLSYFCVTRLWYELFMLFSDLLKEKLIVVLIV